MTLPDRNNPYRFDAFLERLDRFDFWADDPFLRRALAHHTGGRFGELDARLRAFSSKVSSDWRRRVDRFSQPGLHPTLEPFDAYDHRVDRVVRAADAERLDAEIFGEGLFSRRTPPWERLAKTYLLHELGEFGVMCPIACTEGLVALISRFEADVPPEVLRIRDHCAEGGEGGFGIGAQFVTEIQGGSDIPANLVEAEPHGDRYRLHGTKFFCSAVHADYAIVTAKVTGSEEVGAFLVPTWVPAGPGKRVRNGHTVNRLKRKLGTTELPTAEVTYDGAEAWAIGPTDEGVANTVGIVLTLSRIAVGLASAAFMTRAAREALLYSEFRRTFGKPICLHPLLNHEVRELVHAAQRATAAAFGIHALLVDLGGELRPRRSAGEGAATKAKRFALRELVLMQKLVGAHDAVDVVREAMSVFGGHGAIEDFSSLPRLYRDAAVNELWEGPRNVLLMQVFRDLARALQAGAAPGDLVAGLLPGVPRSETAPLAEELADFARTPWHERIDPSSRERAAAWEGFVVRLFRAFQEQALREVGAVPLVDPALLTVPEAWR